MYALRAHLRPDSYYYYYYNYTWSDLITICEYGQKTEKTHRLPKSKKGNRSDSAPCYRSPPFSPLCTCSRSASQTDGQRFWTPGLLKAPIPSHSEIVSQAWTSWSWMCLKSFRPAWCQSWLLLGAMWPGEVSVMLVLGVGKPGHCYCPGSSSPLFLLLMGILVETFCSLERERGEREIYKN